MRGAVLDKFIAQQNIANLRQQLEYGANGNRRDATLRPLVLEEGKLGLSHEQFDEMDRRIARLQQLVSAQLELIAALKSHGRSVERAERALHNVIDVLVVHQARRAKIEWMLPIGTIPRQRPSIA